MTAKYSAAETAHLVKRAEEARKQRRVLSPDDGVSFPCPYAPAKT